MSVGTLSRPPADPLPKRPIPRRITGGISLTFDAITDLAVAGFASWTVLYHLGMIFHIRTNPLLGLWALTVPLLIWLIFIRVRIGEPLDGARRLIPRRALLASLALAAVSAGLVCFGGSGLWWPGWALAVLAVGLGLAALLLDRRPAPDDAPPLPISIPGTLLAAAGALGMGIFAMFVFKINADDAFYVNRAAWVADHGTIATRDTMFSDQTLPAIRGAGIPVASIETLQGAIAHLLHLTAATVAFIATPAAGAFVAIWALWRLCRRWAPRRRELCFIVAVGYLLWANMGRANLGPFFLPRLQEGKVIFVVALIPLIYLYLTDWAARPSLRGAMLLGAAGTAAIGLTSSATFLMPLIAVTAAFPLALTGRYRHALGVLLPAAYPIVTGMVVHFMYSEVNPDGGSYTAATAMHYVFGDSWFGLFGWAAVLVGLWTVRDRAGQLVTAGVAAVLLVILAPGVLELINALTGGAHAVLWRTMWVAPLPVLVGLAATVPLPGILRFGAPVPAAALVALLVVTGMPFWAPRQHVRFVSHPTWRYPDVDMRQAQQILDRRPTGPVLALPPTMRALDMLTTRVHPVSPQIGYVRLLDESATKVDARILLVDIIVGHAPKTPPSTAREALDIIGVSLVCGPLIGTHREKIFLEAGYRETTGIEGAWCLRRPS